MGELTLSTFSQHRTLSALLSSAGFLHFLLVGVECELLNSTVKLNVIFFLSFFISLSLSLSLSLTLALSLSVFVQVGDIETGFHSI